MLRLVASVPALASGSIQTDYTLSRSGRDYEIFSKELVVLFSDLQGPESLSLKNLGLIVSGGNAFMKLDDATGTLLESTLTPLISKYRSKWIALSNASLAMSGSSKEEQLAYKFSENLTKLTLKDIRKYSEKYPLWKLTKDNGILNGFYNYEVTLDKDHLKALILDLSNRLTEQTLDAAATSQIDAILAGFDIVGTFRIDTEDPLYGDLTATIIQKSNPDQITFTFAQARDGIRYSLGTGTDKFTGNILFDTSSKKLSLSLNAVSSGAEIGNLDGYIRFDGSKIAESSLSLSAQGLTASFINVHHPDGSFIGKTVLPVGTLDWTGSIQSDTLKNLFVVGQALG